MSLLENAQPVKAIMIIHGSGRLVTFSYVMASELERRAIAASLRDQVLASAVARSKYLMLVESDDPFEF